MIYEYKNTCECGKVDIIKINKIEAAFGLKEKEINNFNCTECGEKTIKSIITNRPLCYIPHETKILLNSSANDQREIEKNEKIS